LQAAPLDCFASLAMTGWEPMKGRIFSPGFARVGFRGVQNAASSGTSRSWRRAV
jgi:hypothetical protein